MGAFVRVSFVCQHIDRFDRRWLGKQIVRLFHQGGGDLSVHLRLPTVLALCGIEDTRRCVPEVVSSV